MGWGGGLGAKQRSFGEKVGTRRGEVLPLFSFQSVSERMNRNADVGPMGWGRQGERRGFRAELELS